ncbi:hypothetical protein ABE426_11400 [Sphingobacterium faecium]|uniref:hypothetical protein n=1 Tax=Sphingobacterium faecium TaxID=34087 RepID=UPI00320A2756
MNSQFKLPNFPDSNFEIKYSTWFGEQTLYMDDLPLERSNEKGKPFLIPSHTGEIVKAYPKPGFPNIVKALVIDSIQYRIAERLKWYDFAIALLPFCFVFIFKGNSISIGIAVAVSISNLEILRNNNTRNMKYLKVIGLTVFAAAVYYVMLKLFF